MSEHRLRVTAVTLSFNQRPFLERAMRSVLEQDYPVEYIVVDPGSTDGSRDLIERYRARLAQVVLEPDDGPADGLNKALRLATGDVFVCVNADDALLPGAITSAVAALERHPGAAAIYADGYFVDESGRPIRRLRSTGFDLRRFVFGGVNVMHQATFVRRHAFFAVGGFNRDNRTSWDGELLVDLGLARRELRHVAGLWAIFSIHPDSISGSGRLQREYDRDQLRLFEKVVGRSPSRRDRVAVVLARGEKWLCNPRYLVWRITDLVRRPKLSKALP
jgi:glycosyltransferase involved in cell wall biosynthesis